MNSTQSGRDIIESFIDPLGVEEALGFGQEPDGIGNGRHHVPLFQVRECNECGVKRQFKYRRDIPITAITGAFGKYVEPEFECQACGVKHSEGYTAWDADGET